MQIIAYRTQIKKGIVLLQESTGEKCQSAKLTDLFAFLLEPQAPSDWGPQYDRCIRVTWELDVFVSPLLKLLGAVKCRRIHQTHKGYLAPFNVFYIPGKVFSVSHIPTKARASVYELAQYYPELDEPQALEEVQMLGEYLLQQLKRMGLEPTKLTSPVAVYEECVLDYLDLPKLEDIPKEVAIFAGACMGRSWVEAHRLGYWE